MRSPRSETSDIEGVAGKRRLQSRVVNLGIMCQRYHGRSRVEPEFGHGLVGPCCPAIASREPFGGAEHRPRVDDGDIIPGLPRHRRQKLGDVDAAHDDNAARRHLPEGETALIVTQCRNGFAIFRAAFKPRAIRGVKGHGSGSPGRDIPGKVAERLFRKAALSDRRDQNGNPPATGQTDLPRPGVGNAEIQPLTTAGGQ